MNIYPLKTRVITHRGLDPDRIPYHLESSLQAFKDQLRRGYGLEFDVQFSLDGAMIAIHDKDLKRLTNGKDDRLISEMSGEEILAMNFNSDNLTAIPHLLSLIDKEGKTDSLSALHIKSSVQTPKCMDAILGALRVHPQIIKSRLIVFDVTIESARYLKKQNPRLQIAASVSHPFDIKRYNLAVGGTLITVEDLLNNKDLFSWAWLDEWDLSDDNGKTKSLCNAETFRRLRSANVKIALVTPEMHRTSPGLLGGEAHQDASSQERLDARLKKILTLRPDAVCTNHPDYVTSLINSLQ